jgi:hypothetical protein
VPASAAVDSRQRLPGAGPDGVATAERDPAVRDGELQTGLGQPSQPEAGGDARGGRAALVGAARSAVGASTPTAAAVTSPTGGATASSRPPPHPAAASAARVDAPATNRFIAEQSRPASAVSVGRAAQISGVSDPLGP